MNKLILTLIMFFTFEGNAQTYKLYQTKNINNQLKLNTMTGEVYQVQNDGQKFLVHEASTPSGETPKRYSLYDTQNMWTYILLDEFSGKLWQCQYSVKGINYISSWVINPNALSFTEENKFSISPMTSMYQFYLINDKTGEMWKFQWTTKNKDGYRWIEKM